VRIARMVLAVLFVFLAGFNVWNMLANRIAAAQKPKFWNQVHRAAGYAFIALFAILSYFMLLRVKGVPEELSPRVTLHMALALALAPMLFAKVIVARARKGERALLTGLGVAIFVCAFTLVIMNLAAHFLQLASTDKASSRTSETFIVVVLGLAAIGFAKKIRQTQLKSGVPSTELPSGTEQASAAEPLQLILARIESQTHDAKTLRFILPSKRQLTTRPGQFLTFEWIIDGKPTVRSYSICSSPAQTGYVEITSKRVDNGCLSSFLNDRVQTGTVVKARGPYGQFYFDENKHKRIVLIAAGSGITPMMAMLRYIDDRCIPVDCVLIYCIRKEEDAFFLKELHRIETRSNRLNIVFVVSQPSSGWRGWSGRLRRQILDLEIEKPLESTFFLCGPPAFMVLARSLLQDLSVDPIQILQESFGGAVGAQPRFGPAAGSLTVRFARSGVVYKTSPEETLLESSEKNGVLIPWGCRQGNCGTCMTKLVSGDVRMQPHEALSDQQRSQGYILPCVSRPLSDVTLDT